MNDHSTEFMAASTQPQREKMHWDKTLNTFEFQGQERSMGKQNQFSKRQQSDQHHTGEIEYYKIPHQLTTNTAAGIRTTGQNSETIKKRESTGFYNKLDMEKKKI